MINSSRIVVILAVSFLCIGKFAAAQPAEGQYYRIMNVNSKKVLSLGDTEADREQLVQRAHGEGERQQWSFIKVGKHYRIANRQTGQLLNVQSLEANSAVTAKENGKNSQWSLEKSGKTYLIRSRHSGLVIDVADVSKERKAPVIQFSENGGRSQMFEIELVE
jgi:hypothetical protein